MKKFLVGDTVTFKKSDAEKMEGKIEEIDPISNLPYLVKFSDIKYPIWLGKNKLSKSKLTVEQLNTEYMRRDGGEFQVFHMDEKIYGRVKDKDHNIWDSTDWKLDGTWQKYEESPIDLIKKPLVKEWSEEIDIFADDKLIQRGKTFSAQKINLFWKQEGDNDPELVRVEVVK